MDNRAQVREFLASRRARITPGQAGLPAYGGNRRVKGLRREEVALLTTASQIAAGELADPEIRSAKSWTTPSTPPDPGDRYRRVRVTHRFHPLSGRDFEFVVHWRDWGEDRV